MRITIVPYAQVAADYREVKEMKDTSHPTSRSQRFKTARHTRLDILPVIPESVSFTHESPPWTAYGYVLWQPLITRSQKMAESHVVQIPGFLYEDLMRCHAAWVATNRVPEKPIVETVQTWKATRRGKEPMSVLDGERKWFIRLDQMSPKDSPFGGKQPSTTFEDVVTKICSSMRAWNCLQNEQADAQARNRDVKIDLRLNPWDETMHGTNEFPVFYHWPDPFTHPFGLSTQGTADAVRAGAETMLAEIKTYMESDMSQEIRDLLLEHGFSFDVALRQDGSVGLVEVNPFGALSACGACLFNWVRDGKMLYGLEAEVEFVVTAGEMCARYCGYGYATIEEGVRC